MPGFWSALAEASAKAVPTLVIAVVTLALGWFVGAGVTSRWEDIKKRRTLELETLARFYALYGEFFAVWKVWSAFEKREHLPPEEKWQILRQAAEVEGGFEAILVRLTQERVLDGSEVKDLARFREAYQCLRQSIKNGKRLDWQNTESGKPGYLQYQAFKRLASGVASILSREPRHLVRLPVRPSPQTAMQNLTEATDSHQHQTSWWIDPG